MDAKYWQKKRLCILSQSPREEMRWRYHKPKYRMGYGLIDCWMLGGYRVSALYNGNGLMCRSQNVKKEGIHIRISSQHFGLMTLRLIGKEKKLQWIRKHSWPMYRPTRLNISASLYFGLVWAESMTLQKSVLRKECPDMWQNISLRTLYFQLYGLKAGKEYVTANPFPNSHLSKLMRSYYLRKATGYDYISLRQLYLQITNIVSENVCGTYGEVI